MGQFKSSVTREINRRTAYTHGPIWQRNYYEHILRSASDLNRLRVYVESNPAAWPDDDLYQYDPGVDPDCVRPPGRE
ncbi:MAG: hypothetical protein IPM16_13375 [Chloroflexi bacterium]|nr:hypothetical protein [Chloroflexota bacterium]